MKPGEVQTYLPPPPHQILEYLNGHIIGHYVMKKAISVAIYNHFCNINFSRYFFQDSNFWPRVAKSYKLQNNQDIFLEIKK